MRFAFENCGFRAPQRINRFPAILLFGAVSAALSAVSYGQQVATPTISATGADYPVLEQTVTVSCSTAGATIHYTVGASTIGLPVPTESDPVIASGGSFFVDRTFGIAFKAFKSGLTPSDSVGADYKITGKLAAGGNHTVALKSNGDVWAWGSNTNGELGDGTSGTAPRTTPTRVRTDASNFLVNVKSVAAGTSHTLALKSDGTVVAWGLNSSGQLGDGTTTQRLYPVTVKISSGTALSGITQIACGATHSIALKSDGTVWAWGANASGQIGDNTTVNKTFATQVRATSSTFLTTVISIAAGSAHSAAAKADGSAWCWGLNSSGQLGNNATKSSSLPVQVKIGTNNLTGVSRVFCGASHTLALASAYMYGWGLNSNGQLSDNTTTSPRKTAVQAVYPPQPPFFPNPIPVTNVAKVAGGNAHTGVTISGTNFNGDYSYPQTAGLNTSGQLGSGSTTQRIFLGNLSGGSSSLAGDLTTGASHTIACYLDGSLWSWGANSAGQLAQSNTSLNYTSPTLVSGFTIVYGLDDPDGDGLPTWRERQLGTNPLLADTDSDGIPDGWEVNHALNPLVNDSSADPDGDGFTNLQEYQNGTDPFDYYNGANFNLNIFSGNGQAGAAGGWLPLPLVVQTTNTSGGALVNAPVTFSLGQVAGGLAQTSGGTPLSSLTLRTDSLGKAAVYYQQPSAADTLSAVNAQTGTSTVKTVKFIESTATIPISGLTLWLKADSGITKDANNFVSRWADQSANNNDSIQNTASYQPQWVDASLNGKPILRFDGTDDQLVAASSAGSNDFTIFAVTKTTATHQIDIESASGTSGTAGQRYLFGAFNPGGAGVSMGTNGISVYEHSPGYLPALAVFEGAVGSNYNLVTVKYTSRQPRIFLNGYLARTGLTSALATINAPTQIGSGAYGALAGDTAEVLIYNSALTDSDRKAVEHYLNDKYALIPNLPAPPTNLEAHAISSSQIDLVWMNGSANAIDFKLERKTGVSGTFTEIATVNPRLTTYIDSGLSPGVQYFYRVRITNLAGVSDPSNEAGAITLNDVPPVIFAGLTVWLRGDAGVLKDGSSRVTSWTDQSNAGANGNDAKQATVDNQPVWVDDAIYSKPAIQFDGVNDQLVTTNPPSTNNFTIFVVAQTSQPHEIDVESTSSTAGTGGQHYLFGALNRGVDTGAGVSMGTNGISVYEHGTDVMAPLAVDNESVNDYSVATVRYASKQPQIYLNGVLRRVGLTSPRTNVYAPIEIGSGAYGAFSGKVAEVLIYNTALSDYDRRGVENYLGRKYGLIDSDHDGLTDQEELQYGTDPYNFDTNGDGISDGAAIRLGISATSMDTDGDGLTNAQELAMGTDPLVADTDRDGVPDGQDAYPLDPTRWQAPSPDPNDHTPPVITLIEPADAVLLP
jgi:alpha-tubulin suppressor-like RCC1 family protein